MKFENKKKPDLGNGWDELVEKLAREIFDNREAGRLIEPEMVRRHSELIMTAVKDGFGFDFETDSPNTNALKTIENLQRNVYHFSGAKNWNQIKEMSAMLVGKDTQPVSFPEFLKAVKAIDATYNQTYLQSEYQYAQASAQMSGKWDQFQQEKDALPFLEYVAVMDERTRDEHARLNGTVRHVDDPFWKKYYPPNGWRCRCTVRQLDEADAEGRQLEPLPKLPPLPPFFNNNVGETNAVFSEKHPYFETIPKKVLNDVFIASEKLIVEPKTTIGKGFFDPKKKFTVSEKQAVYAEPLEKQFLNVKQFKGGGAVEVHKLYIPTSDHEDILEVAKIKADKEKKVVKILPVIDKKEPNARNFIMPGHKGYTNADYLIDGELWELETPNQPIDKTKIQERISKGYAQANSIIIFLKHPFNADLKEIEAQQFKEPARKTLKNLQFIIKPRRG